MTKSFDYSQFVLVRSGQDWVQYKLIFTQGVESAISGPLCWAVPEKYPCLCASFLLEEAVRSDSGDVQVIDVVVTSFCYEEDTELLTAAIKSTDSKVNVSLSLVPDDPSPVNSELSPPSPIDSASILAVATALELEALGAIKPEQLAGRYKAVSNYCEVNGAGQGLLELFQFLLKEKDIA